MSALPLKADMRGALAHVRFVPIADSCTAANGISWVYWRYRSGITCSALTASGRRSKVSYVPSESERIDLK